MIRSADKFLLNEVRALNPEIMRSHTYQPYEIKNDPFPFYYICYGCEQVIKYERTQHTVKVIEQPRGYHA